MHRVSGVTEPFGQPELLFQGQEDEGQSTDGAGLDGVEIVQRCPERHVQLTGLDAQPIDECGSLPPPQAHNPQHQGDAPFVLAAQVSTPSMP